MGRQFIELGIYLKLKNMVSTGGQAKVLIKSGAVFLNGAVETQVRKKLAVGDKVVVSGKNFVVECEIVR